MGLQTAGEAAGRSGWSVAGQTGATLAGAMGRQDLAQRINRIDIYTNTLDSARERMVRMVSQGERL